MERIVFLLIAVCHGTVVGQGDPTQRATIRAAAGRATGVRNARGAASAAGFAARAAAPAVAPTGAPGGVSSASFFHQRFNRELPQTRAQRAPTEFRLEVARQVTQSPPAVADAALAGVATGAAATPPVAFSTISTDPTWIASWRAELGCLSSNPIPCDPTSPFRTADGSCNNLLRPELGKSFTPYSRYLTPDYDDDIGSPRIMSVIPGELLPSARDVSRAVLRNPGSTIFSNRNTFMVMAWGQFLDHDVVSTPAQKEPDGGPIACCGAPREECFDININQPDPRFPTTCMPFVRSSPTLEDPCGPSRREQIDQLTHWHDASNVYGSTLAQTNSLRAPGGRMATRPGNLPPEDPDPDACNTGPDPADYCPIGGDHRISEVVFLGANHVTWLRLHNVIRDELASFGNPGWDGERLFQETRKIVGALQQHITYDEFIPMILNGFYRTSFCLTRFCQQYSPFVNGAIKNAFAGATLRFGHSLIPNSVGYRSPDHLVTQRFRLRDHFNAPNLYIRDAGSRIDDMQRYATSTGSARADRLLGREVTDHLFEDPLTLEAFDLAALNVQRGRDHGFPSYTRWREFCGLPRVFFFAPGPGGLNWHTPATVARLRSVYRHHDDIDLFAGAMSEITVPGGSLGPTFSCIFALQMRDLKVGDRHYWGRPDPVTGFTFAQRNAIRRARLSTVLCLTSNMNVVQPNVFAFPQPGNALRPCWAIPRLDLRAWDESRRGPFRRGGPRTGPGGVSGRRGFPTSRSRKTY